MTLADETFAATRATNIAEAKLWELLNAIYGGEDKHDDWTTDEHDGSIEVYGVTATDVARDALHGAGFEIVWQHPHLPPRGDCKCPAQRKQSRVA